MVKFSVVHGIHYVLSMCSNYKIGIISIDTHISIINIIPIINVTRIYIWKIW